MEELEYNTQRNKLILSEYGRNVQKMVEFAVNEQDHDKRVKIANELIALMGQLNPHLRDIGDYQHKLWDHLFVMSDFKLEVDSPYTKPTPETIHTKPDILIYPQSRIRYRYYGKNVDAMIKKVAEIEDYDLKLSYINAIGSYMKTSSKTWNDENLTTEEIIAHISKISDGRIVLTEADNLLFSTMHQSKPLGNGSSLISNQNKFNKNKNSKGKKWTGPTQHRRPQR